MEFVGEVVISAALQVLFDRLESSDLVKFAHQQKVYSELNKWEDKLLIIREVLNDAEEKQITRQSVRNWLRKLRDLAYDGEDILDEFSTEMLRSKLMNEGPEGSTSKVRRLFPTCCTSFNPTAVKFNVEMGSKIKKSTKRLEVISTQKAELGLENLRADLGFERATGTSSIWRPLPSTSVSYEPVYGRNEDIKSMVDLLLRDDQNESNFKVIPVVGMGGIGKTALARFVYNDEKMKIFDLRVWVCVSDEFSVVKITKVILKAISPGQATDLEDFNQIQVKLSEGLAGKKFLLVLDDVWNKSYDDWNLLRAPFRTGARGSNIIVTTRNIEVASLMGTVNHHNLKHLSNEQCWSVFARHAFEQRNVDEHPNLEFIGKKIVDRCSGLPLAAKVVGGLLRSKLHDEEWEDVLNSRFWNLQGEDCGILPALRLSYHHLPHI